MWRQTLSRRFHGVVFWLQFPVTFLLGVFSLAGSSPARWWDKWGLRLIYDFVQATQLLVIPILFAILLLAQLLLRWLDSPKVLNAAKGIIDEIHRYVFNHLQDLPEHERRVTLFKHSEHWWRGGLMIPFERSGATTRARVSEFRASKSVPSAAQGVAGQSFVTGLAISVGPLPAITLASPPQEIEEYAKATFVTSEWVRNWLKSHPSQRIATYICGIPIEVSGERWGVMVLDSCGDIKYDRKATKTQFLLLAGILGKLFGGARK